MKAKIIAFANQKGGVGKTTSTINIAADIASLGHRALIVDFDPQGQCATALGLNPEPGVFNVLLAPNPHAQYLRQWIRETGRENLHLIPGDRNTGTVQIVLNAENRPIDSVKKSLSPVLADYDFVFFDTAPSVGGLQERAIWASNAVTVPTAVEFLSAEGVGQFAKMLTDLQAKGWTGGLLGILPTFFDEQTRECKHTLLNLNEAFGKNLILPPIHRATILRECAADGLTIFEKDPNSRAAKEYKTISKIVLRGLI